MGDEPVGVVMEFDNPIGKDELEEGLFRVVIQGDDPEGDDPEEKVHDGNDTDGEEPEEEVPDGEEPDSEEPDGDEENDDESIPKPGQVDATHFSFLRNIHVSRYKLLHT